MLEVNILNKSFTKKGQNQLVFENINLILPNNGLILLRGASGVGKTTFLNIISKLDNNFIGNIKFNNQEITEEFSKKNISYLMQDDNLIENITVYDNLNVYNEVPEDNINNILKFLDILKLKNKQIKFLSSGERRRVSLARTLLKKPKIILADEVTSNLDINNSNKIMELLKTISKNILIIYTSHDDLTYNYANIILDVSNHTINQKIINNLNDTDNNQNNIGYSISSNYRKKVINNTIFNFKSNLINILIMSLLFLAFLAFIILINFDSSKVLTNILKINNEHYIYSDNNNDALIQFKYNDFKNFKLINIPLDNIKYVYYEPAYFNTFTTYQNIDIKDYFGKLPINDNEIMIYQILAEDLIYYYFSEDSSINNISDLINKKIVVDDNVFIISGIIKQDLNIFNELKTTELTENNVDPKLINLFNGKILEYYSEVIITNQEVIDNLNNKYQIFNDYHKNKKIYIENYNDIYNIIKKNTKNYDLNKLIFNKYQFDLYNTEYSISLTNLIYYMLIVSKLSPVILILLIITLLEFIYILIKNYLSKNNKNICILKLLGFNDSELIVNYILGVLVQIFVSIIISLLTFIIIILIINSYLSKIYYFNINIINVSNSSIFSYLMLVLMLTTFTILFIRNYFKKIKISINLRNS